jgi:hypothetical protein
MNRTPFTLDERGLVRPICADEALDVYIVVPITQQWLVYHLAN